MDGGGSTAHLMHMRHLLLEASIGLDRESTRDLRIGQDEQSKARENLHHDAARDHMHAQVGQSYTALAVVSGLMVSLGAAFIRSNWMREYDTHTMPVLLLGFCAVCTIVAAIYATMVFSLLRYYSHAAMAHHANRYFDLLDHDNCLKNIKPLAFRSFIAAFFALFGCVIITVYLNMNLAFVPYGVIQVLLALLMFLCILSTVCRIMDVAHVIYESHPEDMPMQEMDPHEDMQVGDGM
mmetsp:Transcript_35579/g.62856  ORF Transcript_35579/g.62856 Transcript_35579/m.62856 type:complete len:237 (-) Transcript_35579:95-805(-)